MFLIEIIGNFFPQADMIRLVWMTDLFSDRLFSVCFAFDLWFDISGASLYCGIYTEKDQKSWQG